MPRTGRGLCEIFVRFHVKHGGALLLGPMHADVVKSFFSVGCITGIAYRSTLVVRSWFIGICQAEGLLNYPVDPTPLFRYRREKRISLELCNRKRQYNAIMPPRCQFPTHSRKYSHVHPSWSIAKSPQISFRSSPVVARADIFSAVVVVRFVNHS